MSISLIGQTSDLIDKSTLRRRTFEGSTDTGSHRRGLCVARRECVPCQACQVWEDSAREALVARLKVVPTRISMLWTGWTRS